jgi:hypothetical protein
MIRPGLQPRAMKIGYGRVSTRDQNPSAQRDALAAAGCDQVFIDKGALNVTRWRCAAGRAVGVTA